MTVHMRFEQTFPIRFAEWLMATIMSGIGVMSLVHPQLYAASPSLAGMLALADQGLWGWWTSAVGLTGWLALALNGGWRPSPMVRTACAVLRGLVWLQFCFGIALTGIPTLGLIIFPAFVGTEMFNASRAAHDAVSSRHAREISSVHS